MKQTGKKTDLIILALIVSVVLVANTVLMPTVKAAPTELAYDDGTAEASDARSMGYVYAVKFSLPSGWVKAKILTARYYVFADPATFNVIIYNGDGSSILFGPLAVTPTSTGWFDVDLSSYNIIVWGDFRVAWQWAVAFDPVIGLDQSGPDGRSYYRTSPSGSWHQFSSQDIMIRAVVEWQDPSRPVGGHVMATNKLEILAPYMALAGLVAVVSAVVVVKRRTKA